MTSTLFWWRCSRCSASIEPSNNISDVERDQRAHIEHEHPGIGWAPWQLGISHWTER